MEWVELVGRVTALTCLSAPLSGRPCVLYRVRLTVLQRVREGLCGRPGASVAGALFLLRRRGAAGQAAPVLVDPSEARLRLPRPRRRRIRAGQDPGDDERLERLYRTLRRTRPRGQVTGLEQRLEPGDRVWVMGLLDRVADPRGACTGYRRAPDLPRLRATELRVV